MDPCFLSFFQNIAQSFFVIYDWLCFCHTHNGSKTAFSAAAANQVLDAKGLVVAPGLVDVHVHFRDPGLTYKEDIQTGAKASAAGGFTTVVCMANTKPPVDNVETLQHVIAEGKKTGIHVLADATVSVGMKGETLVDMDALRAAGAAGFKIGRAHV